MVDFLTPLERSERMSRIRSTCTIPEMRLRKALHRLGLRYRVNAKELPGKPDIVFPRYKAVVLVHGCFWHHHEGCRIATTPKSNTTFWAEKFARNVQRDRRNKRALRAHGWSVYVVWECKLSSETKVAKVADSLARKLRDEARRNRQNGSAPSSACPPSAAK